MRLQKIIADCGLMSRRSAEQAIRERRVKVNGRIAQIGEQANLKKDVIELDGKRVESSKKKDYIYLMLNKPRGYISSSNDEQGRRVALSLLTGVKERVYNVGRLDMNSEGLLLFTNDGEFANLVMHPKNQVKKSYKVTVSPRIDEENLVSLGSGLVVDGEKLEVSEVRVQQDYENRSILLISLTQGKNRQIRKMCEALGLLVKKLKRVSVGPLKLGMLKTGEYRMLSSEELALFRRYLQGGGKSL